MRIQPLCHSFNNLSQRRFAGLMPAAYRAEELAYMRMNSFGFDRSYHGARFNFVTKAPKSRTPVTLARHRRPGEDAKAARLVS